MPIEFACTHCAKQVRVPDGSEGKKCKCPECQTILTVPTLEIESFDIKLEVPCPRCEFVLVCDPKLEGTRGLCPNCKLIFTIAPPGTSDVEPETSVQMTFAFQCPHCKQLFEGKPGMEGRNGKCIHCKEVFEIRKFVQPAAEIPAAPLPKPIAKEYRPTAPKAVPPPAKKQIPSAKPVATTNDADWLGSLPQTPSYAQVSSNALPPNPYAAVATPASFGAPSSFDGQQGSVASGSPDSIRRFHLSHESAIKGFGLLYGIASGFYILIASIATILSPFAFTAEAGFVAGVFLLIYAAVYFTIGTLTALVCRGLYSLSDSGKIGASIFAVLGLCAIPIGTVLAAYLLFLLFSEKGTFIFSKQYRSVVNQTPHIRCTTPVFIWIILGLCLLVFFIVGVVLLNAMIRPA